MNDSNIAAYLRAQDVAGRIVAEALRHGAHRAPNSVTAYDSGVANITLRYDGEMPMGDIQAWQIATGRVWDVRTCLMPDDADTVLRSVYLRIAGVHVSISILTVEPARAARLAGAR